MLSRLAAGALVAIGLVFAHGESAALADDPSKAPAEPPSPPAQPAPAPPVSTPQTAPHGAVVIATSDGAASAARALAFDVYRDADLRPSVDDATARVLAGDAVAEGASARLKEIAELRASIAHAGSELVARRLLASLGTELGATLVVSVGMDGSRPVARVLRSATATFERVEIAPTADIAADGARAFRWPGATTTLHGFLPRPSDPSSPPGSASRPPAAPAPGPLAPKAEASAAPPAPGEPLPFYKSPWFWGSAGGAALVGLSVFLISRATSSTSDVHLTGRVGP